MDTTAANLVSLCSGVGWLDIGVAEALRYHGVRSRTVAYSERDAYAAAVLRSRMEDETLESAPIWCGDLQEFPAESFRGVVDGIVAGFPCQDISLAGRGDGIRGERSGLWFDILDAGLRMGARWFFLENVAAITVRGLDAVLGSLAQNGFDAEWLCLPASAVGAPHKRDRWFCVAYRDIGNGDDATDEVCTRRDASDDGCRQLGDTERSRRAATDGRQVNAEEKLTAGSGELGDTSEQGLQITEQEVVPRTKRDNEGRATCQPGRPSGGSMFPMGDTVRDRCERSEKRDKRSKAREQASQRRDAQRPNTIFPPGPGDFDGWSRVITDDEQDYLAPATQPGIRVLADGESLVVDQSRADQLRCAGNGVVAIQAAAAFARLIERIAPDGLADDT